MNGITIVFFFIVSLIAVSCGHYNGLARNNVHPQHNIHRDSGLSCSCEDLVTLVALVRALEEKECCSAGHAPNGGLSNAEDLIMNLVNALIQLTTQALSHNIYHCPNQGGNNYPHNPGNGGSGHSHSNGGLLDLNLLDPTKKDNVLDLDVAKQHVLGVGVGDGGGSSQGPKGHYDSNGRNANGGNDQGLHVDLLDSKKHDNVTPSQTTNTNSKTGSSGKESNSGEGLNVNVLNVNKQNNVAEVNLAGQTVLGVGV
ncbi:uncharacterized protein [Maniola hyperantus]|uniref:uncharacterized protein n=1 Tax=Aphantopus hyperantus TaxID=2795564 RepID=UPI001569FE31|nr:uncharacterized protein LOC117981978 [Maniola hyperantus]